MDYTEFEQELKSLERKHNMEMIEQAEKICAEYERIIKAAKLENGIACNHCLDVGLAEIKNKFGVKNETKN